MCILQIYLKQFYPRFSMKCRFVCWLTEMEMPSPRLRNKIKTRSSGGMPLQAVTTERGPQKTSDCFCRLSIMKWVGSQPADSRLHWWGLCREEPFSMNGWQFHSLGRKCPLSLFLLCGLQKLKVGFLVSVLKSRWALVGVHKCTLGHFSIFVSDACLPPLIFFSA